MASARVAGFGIGEDDAAPHLAPFQARGAEVLRREKHGAVRAERQRGRGIKTRFGVRLVVVVGRRALLDEVVR